MTMNQERTEATQNGGDTPRNGRSRRSQSFAVALLVTLLVTLLVALALLLRLSRQESASDSSSASIPFDRQNWASADPEDGQREEMLDDLQERHLRPGITRQEVLQLLGEPGPRDRHTCLRSLSNDVDDTLCYTVSVGLDPCTFLLGFDDAGRLIESVKDCS